MFPIFKLNHVIDNRISKIYIFHGNQSISLEDGFANINRKYNLFTEEEYNFIQSNNIEISYIDKFIHPDDTIIRIKEKIFNEITDIDTSLNELYLFSIDKKKIDIESVLFEFQNNSLQDDVIINKLKLFLMNFVKSTMDLSILDEVLDRFNPDENNIYETLLQTGINWENPLHVCKSIGNYINTKNNYPYVANPFLIKKDEYLEREGENIISTQNNNSLFKFFPIENNNIYFSLVENVINFNKEKQINDSYILKLYFPILFKKNEITSLETFLSQKGNLIDSDRQKIKKYYTSYNKRVDIIYDIFKESKDLLTTKKSGVEFIHFTIKPLTNIKIPLEILFKTFNSSVEIPLIKYNPGKSYENIFRLYTNGHISTTGAKIPDLFVKDDFKKKKLFDIAKQIAKTTSIGFYIYSSLNGINFEIFCNIHENGNVEIKSKFDRLLSVDEINEMMLETINNKILNQINVFLKQKGYNYVLFNDFNQENVIVNNLHYKFSVPNTKKINISKIAGCVTPFFNINTSINRSRLDGLIKLTYKRVSNFHLMNSILSFITIQKQQAESYENIIKLLIDNFEREINTEMKARQYLQQWSQEITIKTETYGNKNRIVESNPGFETIFFNEVFPEANYLSMVMQNINNINYIPLLDIYLHSIAVLIQKIDLSEGLSEKINSMCRKVSKKIKNIEKQSEDIKEQITDSGPIIFSNDVDSLDDLSDFSEEDDEEYEDEMDFADLLEKEKQTEMEKEVSLEATETSLKISKSLQQQSNLSKKEDDDDLESDEEQEIEFEEDQPIESLKKTSSKSSTKDATPAEDASVSPVPEKSLSSISSEHSSAPAVTAADSAPAVTAADSAHAVTAADSAPAVTAADSAPAVTAADSAPAVVSSLEDVFSLDDVSSLEDVFSLDDVSSLSESPGESVSPEKSLKKEEEKEKEVVEKVRSVSVDENEDDEIEIGDEEISFGDDLDPESDDSLESDEEDSLEFSQGGGADSDSEDELDIDLSKYSLSGAKNIFMLRKREKDPKLFLKKDQDHYKSYTRSCPNQYKKQPVLITDEEKQYIDDQDSKAGVRSYDEYIRYGSGEKKYNYICPRFWCVRDENGKARSLSLKQINDGECGGWRALIPENAKKIPKGKRIVEFTDERFHRENAKNTTPDDPARRLIYKPMYPGFTDKSKHPDGLCVPCCFQNPGTKGPHERLSDGTYRDSVTGEVVKNEEDLKNIELPYMYKPNPKPTFETDEKNNIILNTIQGIKQKRQKTSIERKETLEVCNEAIILKNDGSNSIAEKSKSRTREKLLKIDDTPTMQFPLKNGQLGYMSPALESFLEFSSKDLCYTSKGSNINKKLKTYTPCILRVGIEKNRKQSFLCLLASVYKFYNFFDNDGIKLTSKVESLSEFKNHFLENLTIDKFLMAQNGILPEVFKPKTNIAITQSYSESYFLSKITNNKKLKKKLITSYENFVNYIKSDEVFIDYTYLWDLVCRPKKEGGVLFQDGINLLILKNANDDMTSKIEIICPSNYNSNEFFNLRKPTLMVYCENNFFEPLCKMTRINNRKLFIVRKFFTKKGFQSLKYTGIYKIIKKIKFALKESCVPKKSIGYYDFVSNISLLQIYKILRPLGYTFTSQVINNNLQAIGALVNSNGNIFYLPSKPSATIPKLDVVFVNDQFPLSNYNSVVEFLQSTFANSQNRIQCNPVKKIVSDNMIVGIITSSNQFVPIMPEPLDQISDELPIEETYFKPHELLLDNKITTSKKTDVERKAIVKKLTLENSFYSVFRNTLKIILNYRQNLNNKENLKKIISNPVLTYVEKMEQVQIIIKSMLKNVVVFQKIKLNSLKDYDNMINCLGLSKDICDKTQNCKYMLREENGICKVILPKKNLYSRISNKLYYYIKLSDELIRFSKIRKYIFTPKSFLSFQHVKYKINQDEIVLLEELFENYFDNIILQTTNEFINNNIYETTDPLISMNYSNKVDISDEVKKVIKKSKTKARTKSRTKARTKSRTKARTKSRTKARKTATKVGKTATKVGKTRL